MRHVPPFNPEPVEPGRDVMYPNNLKINKKRAPEAVVNTTDYD